MKKILLAIVAVGVIGAAYWLSSQYFAEDEAEARSAPPERAVAIEVAVAERQPLRETITYPGSIMADETVSISPRVSGIIREIYVDIGDYVEVGTPLVKIDDAEFAERVKQAEANLRLAEAQLKKGETQVELTRRAYERVQQLALNGVSMLQELDNAEAAYQSALAEIEVVNADMSRLRAALEEAQLDVRDTRIESPLAGWVQERHADPGALATSASTILTIVDIDPAQVLVYVPERELSLADLGRQAYVSHQRRGDTIHEGVISRVAPSLSMTTRTTEVTIEVENPDRVLRPGMSVDVTLVAREEPNALVIPTKALIFQGGASGVYRVIDGRAYLATVETGIDQEGLIQITSGIEAGDVIVSKGQYLLKDGQPVLYGEQTVKPTAQPLDS